MGVGRQVLLDLTYGGNSIWADVEEEALSFTYTEEASGSADVLTVELVDPDGKWRSEWFPKRGVEIEAAITSIGFGPEDIELDCGTFEIAKPRVSGPPDKISFEATATRVTGKLKRERRSFPWQNISLENLCSLLSGRAGLSLDYRGEEITIDREEQTRQTDLQFLAKLCAKHDHGLKIWRDELRVYSFEQFEAEPARVVIDRADGNLIKYAYAADAHDIYRAVEVSYRDPVRGQTMTSVYKPKYPPPSGSIKRINAKVKSAAQARRIAQKAIRQANSKELTGDLTVVGDLRLRAANNTQLKGFGIADVYPVFNTKVVHSVGSSGFTTSLDFRRIVILDRPRVNADLDVL